MKELTADGGAGRAQKLQGNPAAVRTVAEAPGLLVVDKPAHLLAHPTKPGPAPTLLDELRRRYPGEALALVNRLDRETSGLVMVARTQEAASALGKLVMRGAVEKDYLAVVWGHVMRDHGVIDAPLGRLGERAPSAIYLKQAVADWGRPARTEFWVAERARGFTLLRARLHTGRLHQIRVHLAWAGHPVVGDKIYGPDERLYLEFVQGGWTPRLAERLLLDRHALHAHRVAFPWAAADGGRVEAVSELPGDIGALLAACRTFPARGTP